MKGLRYRIAFGFLIVVLIGLATSVVAVYNFSVVERSVASIIEDSYQVALSAQNMVRHLERQENAQLSMVLDDIDVAYVQFTANRGGFMGWHERAAANATGEQEKALLASIERKYNTYNLYADSLYRLLLRGTSSSQATAFRYQVVRPIAESLKDDCFLLLERSQDAISRTEGSITATIRNSMLTVIIASIGSIVLSVLASIQFIRSLQPLERLTRSVRSIATGNLNQKIDVIATDEIGALSVEFNKMTERLRQYEELNIHKLIAEKKKSETIVGSIADPVVVADDTGEVLLMNAAAEDLFAIGEGAWVGKPLTAVVKEKKWMDVLTHRRPEREESLLTIDRGQKTFYYRPRRTTIVNELGLPQGTVTLLQDVTRFKDLDRMKSDFVATVSHELRTPLTSLNMSVDILLQEVLGQLTDRQRELVVASKDDVERLRKLVHDLLALSRLEAGKQEMHREPVYLRTLVDDALKPLRLPFSEKGIALDVDIPSDLPPVSVDPKQFGWVVTNLANNALRFTENGGAVRFRAQRVANGIEMMVADTGRGIAQEDLEHIFEKFVQVHDGTDLAPGSVGLGLAIARGVVEAHGGAISVESALARGTTFHVTLPLV